MLLDVQPCHTSGATLISALARTLTAAVRFAGLVLMNSAGKIEPDWRAEELEATNAFVPPRLLVDLFSRGLFLCVLQNYAA